MSIVRGQDRIKTEEALERKKEKHELDAAFWDFVNQAKKAVRLGMESGHENVIKAGEWLESHNWPQHSICAKLTHVFHDNDDGIVYYSDRQIQNICAKYNHEDWLRAHKSEQERIEEAKRNISETLTKNVVYQKVLLANDFTASLSRYWQSIINHFENPDIRLAVKLEILEDIEKNHKIVIDNISAVLDKHNPDLDIIATSLDLRHDLPILERLMLAIADLTKSFRLIATIFEKSTKWISQLITGKKDLGKLFCPNCFVDVVPLVRMIRQDDNKLAEYQKHCEELEKE